MLEKPELHDDRITARLREEYGLLISQIDFLPLGADSNTAVYRAVVADGTPYFVKLRSGDFDESVVAVPKLLSDLGVRQVIPPLATQTGRLWAELDGFRLILYPYIVGKNGYEVELSDRHWHELGDALRRIHAAEVPPALAKGIRREEFSPRWRERTREFLAMAENRSFDDPVAVKLAAFLSRKRLETLELIGQAERRAAILRERPPAFVLCHSDLHAGNVLIDDYDHLYIVDWDEPVFAPRERDLMYPGGAQGFRGCALEVEEALFYRGYGPVEIDRLALAYYRFERIVEDIAAFCRELLLSDEGGADRAQALRYLMSNFADGGTIEAAYRTV